MNENVDSLSKSELLSLTIDSLKNNPVLKKQLYAQLLKTLKAGNAIDDYDLSTADLMIRRIVNNIDWIGDIEDQCGEDIFFNGESGVYYNLLRLLLIKNYNLGDYTEDNLLKQWDDLWNESLSNLIKLLATSVDPKGAKGYENQGLLIELTTPEDEGLIDTDRLWGTIGAKGAIAKLRLIDIQKADAGANFVDSTEVYSFYRYYKDITIKADNTDYVGKDVVFYPNANSLLDKISTEEGADLDIDEADDINTRIKSGMDPEFKRKYEIPLPAYNRTKHYTLTGEFSTFKVVSKPWVVPWYNIDGESYSRVRGDDKKLSVLCDEEKLGFTKTKQGKWIRLIMPTNKRKVEVEDLNRNFWVIGQVLAGISISLYDEDGPINKMLQGLLKEIGELWENMAYLWAAMALLSSPRYYDEIHTEVVMLNQDELRQNLRYDDIPFGTILDSKVRARLNYLIDMYPDYNLVILPYIRENNYEHNYFSKATFPGVYIYNRNENSPTWQVKHFYDDDGIYLGSLTIDLEDYVNDIYGILENEETYTYVTPLSHGTSVSTQTGGRFYGLARDIINIYAEMEEHDDIQDIHVDLDIAFCDVGQLLIESNRSQVIYHYRGETNTEDSDRNIYASEYKASASGLSPHSDDVSITRGFYQGELLSCYSNSNILEYAIKFVYVELPPEYGEINTGNIRNNPTTPDSGKYDHANEILKKFYHTCIKKDDAHPQTEWYTEPYDPQCIYILIGHFYYSSTDYGSSSEKLTYYDISGNELVQISKIHNNQDQLYRGAEGIDTGLVIFLPESLSNREISFPFQGQGESMWDYSAYVNYPTGGTDPRTGASGAVFGGNSAYRIDLFLDNNTSVIQDDNWIIKYTTMASVSSTARDPNGAGNQGYVDQNYIPKTFSHDWNKSASVSYDDVWANRYNINERIYVHYFVPSRNSNDELVYTMATKKLERDNLDGDFNNFSVHFTSNTTGTIPSSSTLSQYNANVQQGIKIQGRNKDQVLRANGCKPEIRNKNKKDWVYSDYPDYEQYPNNGYTTVSGEL